MLVILKSNTNKMLTLKNKPLYYQVLLPINSLALSTAVYFHIFYFLLN